MTSSSSASKPSTRYLRVIIKNGRTHLQDATPLTLGQEFSGYAAMIAHSKKNILAALETVRELAIGGTAVGTGLNSPKGWGPEIAKTLCETTGITFYDCPNKFYGLTSHDSIVSLEGALAGLAADLMKIANDIRWLASGPRGGLGEITIPANEPGSSIMPGKVNPTQCEAVTMVLYVYLWQRHRDQHGCFSGNFELNVFQPVTAYNLLQSIICSPTSCSRSASTALPASPPTRNASRNSWNAR